MKEVPARGASNGNGQCLRRGRFCRLSTFSEPVLLTAPGANCGCFSGRPFAPASDADPVWPRPVEATHCRRFMKLCLCSGRGSTEFACSKDLHRHSPNVSFAVQRGRVQWPFLGSRRNAAPAGRYGPAGDQRLSSKQTEPGSEAGNRFLYASTLTLIMLCMSLLNRRIFQRQPSLGVGMPSPREIAGNLFWKKSPSFAMASLVSHTGVGRNPAVP